MEDFLTETFNILGDPMPDSNTVHMPCYLKPADIYNEFAKEQLDDKPHLTEQV